MDLIEASTSSRVPYRVILQVLIVSLGSLAASTPYLAAILISIIGVWLTSAKSLGKMIKKFEDKEDEEALALSSGKTAPKSPKTVTA